VRLDPVLIVGAHEGDGADGASDDELHRQDGVDLADELVADVDGGLCDGAAELRCLLGAAGAMGLDRGRGDDGRIVVAVAGRTLKSSGTSSSPRAPPPKRRASSLAAPLLSAW
jgi:hypothetical protein